MKHMQYTRCPACGHTGTILANEENDMQSCIACGFRINSFSTDMLRIWNDYALPVQMHSGYQRLFRLNKDANLYFHECLTKDKNAWHYLKKRGFTEEDIVRFEFGYTDGNLTSYLLSLGYRIEEIIVAGLADKTGRDFFRYRIMIPIKDNLGNITGFGGRVMHDSKPKYLNVPETPIFHKSSVFYGLHDFDWNCDSIILCEGYMDVISMHKHGFRQTIAGMGTALTQNHCMILKQIGKPVICLYDSDGAGQSAALKNMLLMQKSGISCHCVLLENAKDPDEFLKKYGAEAMKEQLSNTLTRKQLILRNSSVTDIHEFVRAFCDELPLIINSAEDPA